MRRTALASLVAALLLAGSAPAAELSVGAGSSLNLGTGSLDLGCADLSVAGTLSAGSVGLAAARDVAIAPTGIVNGNTASLELSGDWANSGTFNAGTSSVAFVDGCSLTSATVSGNTSFANLSLSTASGKLVQFQSGSTQTVNGLLELLGAAGNLLEIRSTVGGVVAFLVRLGSQSVAFVDVDDSDATGGNPIGASPATSVLGANTPGWVTGAVAPALPVAGIALLALGLAAAARRALRTRGSAAP